VTLTCFGQEPESLRWWQLASESAEAVRALPLHRRFMPYRDETAATLIVEGARPESATWVSTDALSPEATQPHPLRVPWGYAGWLESALAWIGAHADGLHSWKELKSWSLSCVIRAETGRGVVYFKATNPHQPLFANEPLVTKNLAQPFPRRVPQPLAIDPERHWMLLADFGDDLRTTHGESATTLALTDYSLLQQQTLGQETELLKLGCVDRRPAHLTREVARLLTDQEALATLTDDARSKLLAVDWQARIAAYADAPCGLVHGDLHTGNIASGPDGLLYFDWTDACVALPWMDILLPFWPENEGKTQELLAAWSVPLPPWKEVAPLIALHHAVSYRHIRDATEPCVQHELGSMLALFLQKVAEFV
jgi:Phosphotransferase enzyme family